MNPLNHVAIIMDGNGRWGLKNKNSRNLGHKEGLKTIEKIIKATIENKIKYLTLFVFSSENWKRPITEVNFLFSLLENFLKEKLNDLISENIQLTFIGKRKFSNKLNNLLNYAELKTKKNEKLKIIIALDYGSHEEIVFALKKIIKNKKTINRNNISNNLYTKNIPDPDILIRTGNTFRLSNFLLWQLSYSEIFFEKKLWPDFNKNDFNRIVKKFKRLKRNFGAI